MKLFSPRNKCGGSNTTIWKVSSGYSISRKSCTMSGMHFLVRASLPLPTTFGGITRQSANKTFGFSLSNQNCLPPQQASSIGGKPNPAFEADTHDSPRCSTNKPCNPFTNASKFFSSFSQWLHPKCVCDPSWSISVPDPKPQSSAI